MSCNDLAVSVRGLSKSYRIKHKARGREQASTALLDRALHPFQRTESEVFWALRDVEFDIKKGDVVGIIGRNGAGKSTLLKILSRITEPTTGEIKLYGRVGSLLEVGTGFHPELTGRENIYLNGAILGMRKREIDRQFDAIVEFAGVEQFIDTPVKRYSSGMYVRLAFSVAAHLRSEILIIDEVLAVGDMEFQNKCVNTMQDVAHSGRTVLFVSHNMPTVQKLCNHAIMLHDGHVAQDGEVHEIIEKYQMSGSGDIITLGIPICLADAPRLNGGDGRARFKRATFFDPSTRNPLSRVFRHGDLGVVLEIEGEWPYVKAVGMSICDGYDRKIINVNTLQKTEDLCLDRGAAVELIIRDLKLAPGNYRIVFWMGAGETKHIDTIVGYNVLEVLPPLGQTWLTRYDGIFQCEFDHRVLSIVD